MPLNFSGEAVETLNGLTLRATDSNGKTVVVRASSQAIQDYGQSVVERVASDLFDRGQLEADGSVFVRTRDCA
jgi:hypothetical protein